MFPREKLVYLTPDAQTRLTKWDHDATYIVGAIVDKGPYKPLTKAKAKREGIQMARLPLDDYVDWESGSKALPLNIIIKILLEMKATGDWVKALKHLPHRKLRKDNASGGLLAPVREYRGKDRGGTPARHKYREKSFY